VHVIGETNPGGGWVSRISKAAAEEVGIPVGAKVGAELAIGAVVGAWPDDAVALDAGATACDGPADGGVAEHPMTTRIRTQPATLRAPASDLAPRLLMSALARRVFIVA
jgi:hypothetical protein